MSAVALQMVCVAGLLGLAGLAIVLSRSKISIPVIYGATLAVSAIALAGTLRFLLGGAADATTLTLPLGLPWLGAHFRLDALASFFLVVINLGGASASLYGLGYGHHDPAPTACFPSSPPFSPV
jgi:formate hydrogenlyase subunit 3/multisubunit Na+/H+ antiporter MnhD subunit